MTGFVVQGHILVISTQLAQEQDPMVAKGFLRIWSVQSTK